MNQVVDTENTVQTLELAPDRLRAEIGKYYILGDQGYLSLENFSSGRIQSQTITTPANSVNNQVLIPKKKYNILIEGVESSFRDHDQWNDYINQTIITDRDFLDHTFNLEPPSVTNTFVKNFHDPNYEDVTKVFPTNQLLNYNLISYPHKDLSEIIRNIGEIRTRFNLPSPSVKVLLNEFKNRIENYTGSVDEITTKQRNIFNLTPMVEGRTVSAVKFPFYHAKTISSAPSDSNYFVGALGFGYNLRVYEKEKNLFQMIKNDLSFSNRSFTIGRQEVVGKIYNAISLLTSTSINQFSEGSDEIFLLRESDVNHSNSSERFVSQVNTIKFLSSMRELLTDKTRGIVDIYNATNCETILIGYKIEKYIDNDATQPIQTFYTTNLNFVDTQIKYGRKYIYKTKVLLGIYGSSYSYSNLITSQSDAEAESPTTKKYWSTVDVEVIPSFQILEYEIDVCETAFIDTPMLMPQISVRGNSKLPIVKFLLEPRFFTMGSFSREDPPPVGNLRPSDKNIAELYYLNSDLRASPEYFTGIYEVYRMNKPPKNSLEFADAFLTTVDESNDVGSLTYSGIPIENIDIDYARFEDAIVTNQKYYYAFRTLTYNGTPSSLTMPLEIELQRDSDEYKIVIKGYQYPEEKDFTFQKKAKRLIRILPNIERLLFSKEDDKNNWDLDNGELVSKSGGNKTFKIRITSKHTGKKMDINVTFKLNTDDTFN